MLSVTLSSAQSLAHLHAMVVVEELRRCGVGVFCLSPGARAIPLVLALDEHPAVVTKLFNDERSAAFWAQGAAKGGLLPCLVCTSGTAAANYLPAVVEATLAGVPLLLLTTDRPFELHYAKANQTVPQREMFTPFVQMVVDIPAPEQQIFPHSLLADLDQAVFEARRTARPVHINVAYRKPFVESSFAWTTLPPEEIDTLSRWTQREQPYCTYLQAAPRLAPAEMAPILERLQAAEQVVCVAGPLAPTCSPAAIRALAAHLGAPLFADIHSGLRGTGAETTVLALYNLYLRGAGAQLPPADLVLYFGDRIISEPLREYLATCRTDFLLCSVYPLRQDAVENEFMYPTLRLVSDPCVFAADLLAALPPMPRPPTALARALAACEAAAQQRLSTLLTPPAAAPCSEAQMVAEVLRHVHPDSAVFLSASLIFREADYFVPCLPGKVVLGGNRGATGIDGVLSSGVGFAESMHKPGTVILGDQALLHDLNALSLLSKSAVPIYVIVINNHSGAIFHFFDLGTTGERLRNAHGWDFRSVAENFHLDYQCPTSREAFVRAYKQAQQQQRSTVFEIVVDGAASVRMFQAASAP
ncbi:MAG: 2-succinyl-5-enolpyruvyl-6-hydroxy-3-cyclohexene-1-carboxylic-acid synthase [Candidatus Tectimicrobiota bacterium]